MCAITGYYRATSRADALRWLLDNRFSNINGHWMDGQNRFAIIEKLPSGRLIVKIGVA
jgi:hypothetical protein